MTRPVVVQRLTGLTAAVAILVVVVGASLALGARAIDPGDVLAALFAPVSGDVDHTVVRDLRYPRTILGLIGGAALGLAGALMQGLTRNPLADPGLLGVNAGASLFVVIGIAFLGASTGAQAWLALAGAAVATVVVYLVGSGRGAGPVSLTLAGTAVTAALTSIITLLLLGNLETLNQYRFWSVGSLVGRQLDDLGGLVPFLVIGAALALLLGPGLNLLALGADVARGLGLRVGLTRGTAALAIVLLCGGATALVGPIVFVGLVAPHAARRLAGADYRWILVFSALIGAAMLPAADVIGRLIVPPGELEAGIVVAVVGAPLMIALVRRTRLVAL
jgi:iron complex transport system permease protein